MMKKKEKQALARNQRIINEQAALFPEETVQDEGESVCDCVIDSWGMSKNVSFISPDNIVCVTIEIQWSQLF